MTKISQRQSTIIHHQFKNLTMGTFYYLALYKSKVLARNFRYQEAEELLEKCINFWPEDGRPYVALGKIYNKQSIATEDRSVYEKGCQATQTFLRPMSFLYFQNCRVATELREKGISAYLHCMLIAFVLGTGIDPRLLAFNPVGEYIGAHIVDDLRQGFAWHMWGVFETNQGNIDQERKLLKIGHALNPRDPVFLQTLALLVWIAWGWMEWKEGNIDTPRELYQKHCQ
ncbi:hypothetical protein POM88_051893 [Heracleum sosnowskyi]|uniref:Tetratricopeptide repeat protein n=1 Tax=Heracleum sosnowskyi TaxID=360622 RepID=A0AAD8GS37_9APIA|nr:hypothetical protein POM88_051893 [Heracleum sosnowskyi]